jgi:galactitol-specific phosphotransferase system IIB component
MIKFEDIQKANETIKTTDIKGKNYAEVNQRIKAFRMVYPTGTIETKLVSNENGVCIFRALVSDGKGNTLGTGTAYEKEDSSFINKTSYIENCETSAVGRALGMCGIGINTSVASAEEVQNAINNQTLTQEEADSYTLTFGKYKGMTLKDIEEKDHKYINWIMDNTKDERILKMIEMSLGYALPDEEEQTKRFELLDKVNNLIIEKDIDLEAIKKKFKVESTADIDTKTLKELVVYLEGK